ncbi:protein SDA1 homolog [Venturia canescens]|uniref:protein SDA1 homolog n=1 Tax=Venturia canescens TaxID=32260 RepID=UPI001C9C273E|nr:protein SDA1 homolog [Venturia canescens]
MVRHNNQLPDNLPQLQNLIKRDPESYKEEFQQQYRHYKSTLEVFRLTPDKFNKSLDELSIFLAQVAHCYAEELVTYPQEIVDILQEHNTILDNEMRMTLCRTLILLRNKGLLEPTVLLSLFFQLLRCQDKALRQFLQTHIITDIKNVNAKHKNARVNTSLQNFMFTMLKDSNSRAAKMSADIMIELYNKNVWNDAKTVNVIASGCFSKITKVMVASLKFFLGTDPEEKGSDDSDSDDEPNVKEVAMANRVNKKTKKREKQLKKVKQLFAKAKNKKSKAPVFNFSALHLIHDPQGFAEKLFKQLEKNNDRFEIKLMSLDVISRLIGLHNLFLFNFYPYIQRFLQPHQREVTKLLQFVAQSSHELVPPEILEPVLKTLVNNFVTERNSADVMAIGLNAVREIASRCPLVMNEDLLRDLAQYKNYRERSVMMAARSLISLFRNTMPALLHKKDRGRPTETTAALKPLKYGEFPAKDFVPGADVLLDDDGRKQGVEIDSEDSEDCDEWVDIEHSSGEEVEDSDAEDEGEDESEESEEADSESEEMSEANEQSSKKRKLEDGEEDSNPRKILKTAEGGNKRMKKTKRTKLDRKREKLERLKKMKTEKRVEMTAEKEGKASQISVERLLTDEDFKRIDMALVKQQITHARKGGAKRNDAENSRGELVKLGDIENIYKKRKHDKQARMDSVKEGQKGRERFGYKDGRQNPLCSKTNREKKKTKAFQMIKHKIKGKTKRSFKEKQIALRNHLIKQKRMK